MAIAAALVVLVAVGVIPFLAGGDQATPPAGTVVPTTMVPSTVPDTQASSDDDEAVPPSTTVPEANIDLDAIPLPLITEVVTSSSVGDVVWRVFESDGEEQSLDVMRDLGVIEPAETESVTEQGAPPTTEDIISVEGAVAINASSNPVTSVRGAYLTEWRFSFDPIGTLMLNADEALLERAAGGTLLGFGDVTGGTIEVALYSSERDADLSTDKPAAVEGEPTAIVARYALETEIGSDGTMLRVFDVDTGDLVGTVTAVDGLEPDHPIHWGFPLMRQGEYYISSAPAGAALFTLSGPDGVSQVRPGWAGLDLDAVVDTGDRVLLYAQRRDGEGSYEVWATSDGRSWSSLGAPTGWPAGYAQPEISHQNGLFRVDLNDQVGGRADNIFLQSPDGVHWAPIEGLPQGNGRLISVTAGFAWVGSQEVELWTSPDGVSWEMVDLTEIPVPLGGLVGGGDFPNGTWFHQAGDADRLWVLEFTRG